MRRVSAFAGVPIAATLLLLIAGCRGERYTAPVEVVPGGDPQAGAHFIEDFRCGACHTIPGIKGADGLVAPPLMFFARRSYVGGELPNTPPNLIRWIQNPPAVEPGTAMPVLGVNEQQARDIAAYLYTLR